MTWGVTVIGMVVILGWAVARYAAPNNRATRSNDEMRPRTSGRNNKCLESITVHLPERRLSLTISSDSSNLKLEISKDGKVVRNSGGRPPNLLSVQLSCYEATLLSAGAGGVRRSGCSQYT